MIWNAHYPGIISQQQIDYMLLQGYSREALQVDLDNGVCIDKLLIEGHPRGFAAYGPTDNPLEIKLHKLYLDPQLHGKGLGSILLDHCENVARAQGKQKILLQVNKDNSKAIKAYEHNGYTCEQAVVVNIGKGFVMNDFIMVKGL